MASAFSVGSAPSAASASSVMSADASGAVMGEREQRAAPLAAGALLAAALAVAWSARR